MITLTMRGAHDGKPDGARLNTTGLGWADILNAGKLWASKSKQAKGATDMTRVFSNRFHNRLHSQPQNRRAFLLGAASAGAALSQFPLPGILRPALASGFAPTQSMRGGANNYRPNAPLVDRLGSGFWVSGTVRRAGDGVPLEGVRIQIWAATTLGGEREPRNHGSVLTAADGSFRLEMEQIVPNFGQPHAHLAYDDADYETVFLRPVMPSAEDTSVSTDFVLAPA